jgi:AAA+ ATPase superfamily predicted ATPase
MLVGRLEEIKALNAAMSSDKGEMIAVIGRRRVGKTFLITEMLGDQIVFQQTGIRHASPERQLRTFSNKLSLLAGREMPKIKDWLDAFFQLRMVLEPLLGRDEKLVLFFDELSWLATPGSEFLDYLAHFWNDWAARQKIVVVLCGSVSSWIINKVINDKGGLHNRVTRYLHLKPFTLLETEAFLTARHVNFTRYQIFQLYMALGGIPLYLEDIEVGRSVAEAIDKLCFSDTGLLREEFARLYPALFDDAHHHIEVIRTLAEHPRGLSRAEIIALSNTPNGGTATRVLEELEQSDFIMSFLPFGKRKKGKLYRLIDEYSLFYLRFIEMNRLSGAGTWMKMSQQPAYKIWGGYAFESICMKHVPSIKKALNISGVYTNTYSYAHKRTEDFPGVQVDMLLERADGVINLFEIKFHRKELALTETSALQLLRRKELFERYSKTKDQVILTLMVSGGFKANKHSLGLVGQVLEANALFLE